MLYNILFFFSVLKLHLFLYSEFGQPCQIGQKAVLSPECCHGLGSSSHLLLLSVHLPLRPLLFCHFFVSGSLLWMPSFRLYLTAVGIAVGFQGYWPFSLWTKVLKPQTWNLPLPKREYILNSFNQLWESHFPLLWQMQILPHLTKQR